MNDLSCRPALAGAGAGIADPTARERLAQCCLWLADLFAAAPRHETVASYRHGEAAAWLASLSDEPDLGPGIARVRRALDAPDDDGALTSRVAVAHAHLFLGVGGPDTVPPYESAWRCGGRLFQEPAAEMERLLADHGLAVRPDAAEPADHLSVELALRARLLAAADPAADALHARLAGWVPAFCAACARRDASGFWAGAALVLAAILARGPDPVTTRSIRRDIP